MPSKNLLNFLEDEDYRIQSQDLEDRINSVAPWIEFFIKQIEIIDIDRKPNIEKMKEFLGKTKKRTHDLTFGPEIDSIQSEVFQFLNNNRQQPVIHWLYRCQEKYFDLTDYDYERSFNSFSERGQDIFSGVLKDCEMVLAQDFSDAKNRKRLLNFLINQKKLIELKSQKDEQSTQVFRKNVYTVIGLIILLLLLSMVFPPVAFLVVIGLGALSLGYINFNFFKNCKSIDRELNECKKQDEQLKQQIPPAKTVIGSTPHITHVVGQGLPSSKPIKSSNFKSKESKELFSSKNSEPNNHPTTGPKPHAK